MPSEKGFLIARRGESLCVSYRLYIPPYKLQNQFNSRENPKWKTSGFTGKPGYN
jgi:hypothetical protein